jgi:hypothetical protein
MNLAHSRNSNKLVRTGDLRKEKPRDDDLRAAVGHALQSLQAAIVAAPADAGLQAALNAFTRALAQYHGAVNSSPEAAARVFARELDRIISERALGQAMKSSLAKGYAPQDFWRR